MKALNFIAEKKIRLKELKAEKYSDMRTASKLGFETEFLKVEKDVHKIQKTIDLLNDIENLIQKERLFNENEISRLQDEVHKITGDGEVMMLFNNLLGVVSN